MTKELLITPEGGNGASNGVPYQIGQLMPNIGIEVLSSGHELHKHKDSDYSSYFYDKYRYPLAYEMFKSSGGLIYDTAIAVDIDTIPFDWQEGSIEYYYGTNQSQVFYEGKRYVSLSDSNHWELDNDFKLPDEAVNGDEYIIACNMTQGSIIRCLVKNGANIEVHSSNDFGRTWHMGISYTYSTNAYTLSKFYVTQNDYIYVILRRYDNTYTNLWGQANVTTGTSALTELASTAAKPPKIACQWPQRSGYIGISDSGKLIYWSESGNWSDNVAPTGWDNNHDARTMVYNPVSQLMYIATSDGIKSTDAGTWSLNSSYSDIMGGFKDGGYVMTHDLSGMYSGRRVRLSDGVNIYNVTNIPSTFSKETTPKYCITPSMSNDSDLIIKEGFNSFKIKTGNLDVDSTVQYIRSSTGTDNQLVYMVDKPNYENKPYLGDDTLTLQETLLPFVWDDQCKMYPHHSDSSRIQVFAQGNLFDSFDNGKTFTEVTSYSLAPNCTENSPFTKLYTNELVVMSEQYSSPDGGNHSATIYLTNDVGSSWSNNWKLTRSQPFEILDIAVPNMNSTGKLVVLIKEEDGYYRLFNDSFNIGTDRPLTENTNSSGNEDNKLRPISKLHAIPESESVVALYDNILYMFKYNDAPYSNSSGISGSSVYSGVCYNPSSVSLQVIGTNRYILEYDATAGHKSTVQEIFDNTKPSSLFQTLNGDQYLKGFEERVSASINRNIADGNYFSTDSPQALTTASLSNTEIVVYKYNKVYVRTI